MQDDPRTGAFRQAIDRLGESLVAPRSGMARDSSIKGFELCFELSWKVIQSHLRVQGIVCRSPRDCLKEAFTYGLLQDERLWARMAQDRNLSVHSYNEDLADTIYGRLPDYLDALHSLSRTIEADPEAHCGEATS